MPKNMTNAMYDGGLDKQATCNRLTVLSGEPTSMADITTNMRLASVALVGGDFTKAAGDVSGRKVTVAQKTGLSITATGTATHVAVDDGTDWVVTTCTSQALTAGGTVTVPAWKREISAAA
jgi:hypothetical protein